MFDLEQIIRERHSTRLFLPRPVPRELLDEALALAVRAPSNSNIQPWRVVFASGPTRDRLVAALLEEAHRGPPNIPPLPESFRHFRKELGAEVYGAMGITREDKAGHDSAVLRNWEFFRAPLAGIVCMHRQGECFIDQFPRHRLGQEQPCRMALHDYLLKIEHVWLLRANL